MDLKDLLREAEIAREKAYAPYSGFKVGAALLTPGGKIYRGANVENASYGLSICAERTAIFTAVAAGEKDFTALALVAAPGTTPCGACRQVIMEFAHDAEIVFINEAGEAEIKKARELLPATFTLSNML